MPELIDESSFYWVKQLGLPVYRRSNGEVFSSISRDGLGHDLNDVFECLNAVRSFYELDPCEWTADYLSPLLAKSPHMILDCPGLGTTYFREAIDATRAAASLPAFPWATVPSTSEWQDITNAKRGVSALHITELKQAIGRIVTSSTWGMSGQGFVESEPLGVPLTEVVNEHVEGLGYHPVTGRNRVVFAVTRNHWIRGGMSKSRAMAARKDAFDRIVGYSIVRNEENEYRDERFFNARLIVNVFKQEGTAAEIEPYEEAHEDKWELSGAGGVIANLGLPEAHPIGTDRSFAHYDYVHTFGISGDPLMTIWGDIFHAYADPKVPKTLNYEYDGLVAPPEGYQWGLGISINRESEQPFEPIPPPLKRPDLAWGEERGGFSSYRWLGHDDDPLAGETLADVLFNLGAGFAVTDLENPEYPYVWLWPSSLQGDTFLKAMLNYDILTQQFRDLWDGWNLSEFSPPVMPPSHPLAGRYWVIHEEETLSGILLEESATIIDTWISLAGFTDAGGEPQHLYWLEPELSEMYPRNVVEVDW